MKCTRKKLDKNRGWLVGV